MSFKRLFQKIFPPYIWLLLIGAFSFSYFCFHPFEKNTNIETLFDIYYPGLIIAFAQLLLVLIIEGIRKRKANKGHTRFNYSLWTYFIVLIVPLLLSIFIQNDFGINIVIASGLYCLILSVFIILVQIIKKRVITWEDLTVNKKK